MNDLEAVFFKPMNTEIQTETDKSNGRDVTKECFQRLTCFEKYRKCLIHEGQLLLLTSGKSKRRGIMTFFFFENRRKTKSKKRKIEKKFLWNFG